MPDVNTLEEELLSTVPASFAGSVVLSGAVQVLEEAGAVTISSHDSQQALDLVASDPGPIDLAILDLTMPGMSGDVLLRRLRELRPRLPAVLSSGYGEVIVAGRLGEVEVSGFLEKPYTSATLRQIASAALVRDE